MAAQAGTALVQIFGHSQIGDIVKAFDFSKLSVTDTTKDDHLHIGLAPSYGKLTSEAIKKMDDKLKIMIAGTVKTLQAMNPADRTWENVVSAMMQNPLLEPDGPDGVQRSDRLLKSGSADFKFDGSPDAAIVQEVKSWFTKLINDAEVLKSTKIDIDVLAKIVAQTGATVDSFETLFVKDEHHEKTMVDIGVLRFPDIDKPHFQVYRIQLTAWSQSKRILFHQEDSNGIVGVYNSRNFKPRADVIAGMKEESKKVAIKMADDLFGP